ncbi:MAG: hypothetical protein HZB56_10665 [Deltaproteobacteria bacterium]|nr:hypothetical protein [Deltaproteobacteria bacterium]
MWFYENLGSIVGGLFATGVGLHFFVRSQERNRYRSLRRAYENAVGETRALDGDPAAVVREAELYRAFMHSWLPGWFEGFGRCIRTWLKYCAAFALLALFLKGPIERGEAEIAKKQARAAAAAKARVAGSGAPQR